MKKLGIIHTTSATINSLTELVKEVGNGVKVINILDDSILSDMMGEHQVDFVRERWISYAENLEKLGVDAVLSACSTVGEFAEEADGLLDVPVYRIDDAMAERAVESGRIISVFATLNSTLRPTVDLIQRKAAARGYVIQVNTILVEGAYDDLMKGDREHHDTRIREAVAEYLECSDAVVLAQASMASAIGKEGKEKVLTSPRLGIETVLGKLGARG